MDEYTIIGYEKKMTETDKNHSFNITGEKTETFSSILKVHYLLRFQTFLNDISF